VLLRTLTFQAGPTPPQPKRQIRSLVLCVDLDGSRRVPSDRLDDQAARRGILSGWLNDLGSSGQAAFKFAWVLGEVAGDVAQ
jgi:hypothetical protein